MFLITQKTTQTDLSKFERISMVVDRGGLAIAFWFLFIRTGAGNTDGAPFRPSMFVSVLLILFYFCYPNSSYFSPVFWTRGYLHGDQI